MYLSQVHCVVMGAGAGCCGGTWEILFLPPDQPELSAGALKAWPKSSDNTVWHKRLNPTAATCTKHKR